MAPPSPTIARWELALRIRERRTELGIDVKTVANALKFSRNYWSTVENDRAVLSENKLKALAGLFRFTDDETNELLALREATKARGWWSRLPVPDENLARLYGLEFGASRLRAYEATIVTGLLQTESYARALFVSDPSVSPVDVKQLVQIRLQRQERIGGDDPLHIFTILSEAALHQQVGGPDVLRNQLLHLVRLINDEPDSVDIRILPFTSTGGHVVGGGATYLLEFDSPHLPAVAYQESVAVFGFAEDSMVVNHLSVRFDQAQEHTLNREASLDLIEQRVRELG